MSTDRMRHMDAIPLALLTTTDRDGEVRLAVGGEVDMATVSPLKATMASILDRPDTRQLVVDFADVTFLDSTGIAALLAARTSAQTAQIPFRLAGCRPPVLKVLTITGLDRWLTAPCHATDDGDDVLGAGGVGGHNGHRYSGPNSAEPVGRCRGRRQEPARSDDLCTWFCPAVLGPASGPRTVPCSRSHDDVWCAGVMNANRRPPIFATSRRPAPS
jgi:anti-sigma B factor antagonist